MKNLFTYTLLTTTVLTSSVFASFDLLEGSMATPERNSLARRPGYEALGSQTQVRRFLEAQNYAGVLSPFSRDVELNRVVRYAGVRIEENALNARLEQLGLDAVAAEEERIRRFNARMASLHETSTSQQTQIDTLTLEIQQLNADLSGVRQNAADLETQLAELSTTATITQHNLDRVTQENAEKDQELETRRVALETRTAEMQREIITITTDSTQEKDVLTARLTALDQEKQALVAERDAVIASRARNVQRLQEECEKARQTIIATETALAQAKAERDAKEMALQAFQTSLEERLAAQAVNTVTVGAGAVAADADSDSDSEVDSLDGKKL